MSGKYSRNKGARFERELVNKFTKSGIKAKRISMMETNGIDKGDLVLMDSLNVQVKGGNQVPKFIYYAIDGFDILAIRRDREDWLITMDYEFFVGLIKKLK